MKTILYSVLACVLLLCGCEKKEAESPFVFGATPPRYMILNTDNKDLSIMVTNEINTITYQSKVIWKKEEKEKIVVKNPINLTMNVDGTNSVYGLQRSWAHTFNGSKFTILNTTAQEITVPPNSRVEILCTNEVESITHKGKVIWKKEDVKAATLAYSNIVTKSDINNRV